MELVKENNEDIDSLIKYLNSKVEELKKKGISIVAKTAIKNFYNDIIISWQENFMLRNKEPDEKADASFKNKILDMIHYINKISKR